MKKRLFTFLAIAGLILAGCSNNIDTAKVRAAFQSIPADQKTELEQGLAAIDAGKYKDALMPLRKVAYGAKLDKDQTDLLAKTIEKVRKKIADGQ